MKVVIFVLFSTFSLYQTRETTCWSSPIAEKYKPDIDNLQERLQEAYSDLNVRQSNAQAQLKTMLMQVKVENNNRIKDLKKSIGNVQSLHVLTKNCGYQQNIEVRKIYNRNHDLECLPNKNDVTILYNIKQNILKLEKVTSVLVNFCQYLNPLERESNYLNMCIANKIRHINLQIHVIELEFKTQLTHVMNSVKRCLNEEGNIIEKNLNAVASNLHKCNLV